MLTWASVFGLIADGLRAWNDGKWATQNEQTLHFKRSSGHLNAEKLLLHLSLLPQAFSHYYGGSCFPSSSPYYMVFGLTDLWILSVVFFSMLGKQEVFDVASVWVHTKSKVKFGGTFFLESRLQIELHCCFSAQLLWCSTHFGICMN